MDVKKAFLNGFIKEEMYVKQPLGFEDPLNEDYVCMLTKAIYGLKQGPRVWYGTLNNFLSKKKFKKGNVHITLYIKRDKKDILIVQIYVDDIIFGSTYDRLCKEFSTIMQVEFEMSIVRELNYFLELQTKQLKD